MRIPEEVVVKYGVPDPDVGMFVTHFDAPPRSRVLVVGSHDEPTANMLAESGFQVVGVDLREYQASDPGRPSPDCNYRYVRGDFCSLGRVTLDSKGYETFFTRNSYDVFVSISAIEHFGLGAYGEGYYHPYYDVIAMRKAWELLEEGGLAYVTVPVCGQFIEVRPHWRVYDLRSVQERLIQDFELCFITTIVAGPILTMGLEVVEPGTPVTREGVDSYLGSPPHVSALVVMKKVSVKRLAPDGR